MKLALIVAVAENGVIGRQGDLPWRLSADLQRFKRATMGHTMLMGRKTWESIGRPLPGRRSIVVSRDPNYKTGHDEVPVAGDLDTALQLADRPGEPAEQVFVIGGAKVYELTLPRADRLFLTRVHASVEGDVFFPPVDWDAWRAVEEDYHSADEKNEFAHTFQVFERDS